MKLCKIQFHYISCIPLPHIKDYMNRRFYYQSLKGITEVKFKHEEWVARYYFTQFGKIILYHLFHVTRFAAWSYSHV